MLSLAHLTVLDAHPLELIDAALAGGFDALGLRIVAPMPTDTIVPVIGDEPLIRSIEERLDATGRRIFDIEAVWLMPHTDVAALEPALALGSRLGAKHLLVVGNDPDDGRLAANFSQLCDLAGGYGIGVALEPIPYVQLATPSQGLALLEKTRKPNAKLLIDALHLYRSGANPADLAAIDPSLFPYIHLCDATATPPPPEGLRPEGRGGRFYPGEGELPLARFLRAFPANIPIGIEAPCARYAHLSVLERARICGAATRALLSGIRAV
ncbi:sugar phosphate isomerase/epimerase [Acidisphaera sp. S103]|uniref:sugar phosphate isomerase/epimerase family protein n=1 Tax=Acidisphaera sp. S103 TaxID=1747223 RepID=UPI00131BE9A7|nr:TIM barrel protein [Acidisphaera sp. S103]